MILRTQACNDAMELCTIWVELATISFIFAVNGKRRQEEKNAEPERHGPWFRTTLVPKLMLMR